MLKGKKLQVRENLSTFLVGGGILLLMVLLSACGYNGTTVGSQPPTPPTPTPTQPLTVKNCGTVHSIRNLVVPAEGTSAKQNETCFAQAYAACHPATLIYSQNSLDTGTIHNFAILNQNGKCTITDKVQSFVAPRAPQTTGTYTCSSTELKNDGLHVNSCGAVGSVIVPLATQ